MMCNTTCSNHSHEEYNIDYIERELALDITSEDVPCLHEQTIYVIQDTDDVYEDNSQSNCTCSKCEEPKKVSCRSLACQQLNNKCSCEQNDSNIKKTTMASVLLNNMIRLEDQMNNGCSSMHESIEELEDNIDLVYKELKDEEARAKLQEAFLHYGLDDAITRVWYNPEDRLMHFYHKNPANCLNVNVHEGCDCDCCNACGCECNCNKEECKSDIPYTMDENCNIVPMSRDEEELFTIDCRDFIRDIFVNSARLEYEYPNAIDGNTGKGPWLVISYKRFFETDLSDDDIDPNPVEDLWIDLGEIWKLENYYDKPGTRDQIKRLKIVNTGNIANFGSTTGIANLIFLDLNGDVNLGTVNIVMPGDPAAGLQQLINNLGNTINNLHIPGETTVNAYNPTLSYGQTSTIASINGTAIKVTMPSAPEGGGGGNIPRHITNITLSGDTVTFDWSDGGHSVITVGGGGSGSGDCLWTEYSDGVIPKNGKKVYGPGFYDTTVS